MYPARLMTSFFPSPAIRFRVLATRFFGRIGLGEGSFLLILAVLVGIVTASFFPELRRPLSVLVGVIIGVWQ